MVLLRMRLMIMVTAAVMLLTAAVPAAAEIKFGILPRLNAVEMFTMFNPLAEYLTRETGEKVSIVIPRDFDAFKNAVKAGQVGIAFANSLIYVQLKREVNIEPLALAAEMKAGTRFRGIIIARKDSGIEKLRDLKGKKLVFVDKNSAAGYIFQLMLLKKAGLDIRKDLTVLPFARMHDNVVKAVYNRAADAGGIREDDLEKMAGIIDLSQIRIVGYTDYFPNWPLFATSALPKEVAEKVREALLKLTLNDPRSLGVLRPAKLSGFAPVADSDYDQLRVAAKLAGALP